MKKIAFLYAGQGSQYPGMGIDFFLDSAYKDEIDLSNKILGFDIKKVLLDEEKVNKTEYTQPLLFLMQVLITRRLQDKGITSTHTAGLSLGEYAALYDAGCIDFKTGIYLLKERAKLMAQAAKNTNGKMVAIIGLSDLEVEDICNMLSGCQVANYNTIGQVVISGETKAVLEGASLAKKRGAKRVIELNTTGAFHSPLMEPAKKAFANILKPMNINNPSKKLYVNVTGNIPSVDLKQILAKQITSPVLFKQTLEHMLKDGVDTFIEIGPKKTLSSFVKKINRQATILHIEDEASMQVALNKLGVK